MVRARPRTLGAALFATGVVCAIACHTGVVRPARCAPPALGDIAAPVVDEGHACEPDSRAASGYGPIGSAHPFTLTAVDPFARWVALCQSRADTDGDGHITTSVGVHGEPYGDTSEPYLVWGSGPGDAIDDFVTSTSDGSHLVVRRGSRLVLFDASTRVATDLGESAPSDPRSADDPVDAAFDEAGEHIAYIAWRDGRARAYVRALDGSPEIALDAGDGRPWSVYPNRHATRSLLEVLSVPEVDDAGVSGPRTVTTLAPRRCRGPAAVWGVYGRSGIEPESRVVNVATRTVRSVPGFLQFFGDRMLRRRADGALIVVANDGSETVWGSTLCHPVLVHTDSESGRALVACTGLDRKIRELYVASDEGRNPISLEGEPWRARFDGFPDGRVGYFEMHGGNWLVDLRSGRTRPVPSAALAGRTSVDGWAFIRAGGSLGAIHVPSGVVREIAAHSKAYFASRAGRFALVPPSVIDVMSLRTCSTAPSDALAVDAAGRVLVPTRASAGERNQIGDVLPSGPLAWVGRP